MQVRARKISLNLARSCTMELIYPLAVSAGLYTRYKNKKRIFKFGKRIRTLEKVTRIPKEFQFY